MRRARGQRNRPGRPTMAGSLNRLTRNGRTACNESGPPRFINTTATRAISHRSYRFGEQLSECLYVLERRLRQHTMAEVEDKGSSAESSAQLFHLGLESGAARDQQNWVEISLHSCKRLQPLAGIAGRNHWIEADPVDPGFRNV